MEVTDTTATLLYHIPNFFNDAERPGTWGNEEGEEGWNYLKNSSGRVTGH